MPSAPGPVAHPPQLSVVIACLNAEDVIDVQLAALARQECPVAWELLVCDNGSTDATVAAALRWADRLPLRVVLADHVIGSGPARNAGVAVARGEWIGFCDADDQVADDWLAVLCAALEKHRFVAGHLDARRLNSEKVQRSRALDQQDGLQLSSAEVGLPHAAASNLGIHRSVFEEVGGFDPAVRYLQDTDLCWRVQIAGYPLTWVPELVVHMRLRSTLRGMYRQGRNYGRSQARLEHRYAGAASRAALRDRPGLAVEPARPDGTGPWMAAPSAAVAVAAPRYPGVAAGRAPAVPGARVVAAGVRPGVLAGARAGLRAALGALRLVRYFIANRSSLGACAWQIGWHIGHRSGV